MFIIYFRSAKLGPQKIKFDICVKPFEIDQVKGIRDYGDDDGVLCISYLEKKSITTITKKIAFDV